MAPRKVPRSFKMPWGKGKIIEEASIETEFHEPTLQLMKFDNGHYALRFAHYSPKGVFQRSPLMLDTNELKKLKRAVSKTKLLKKFLKEIID